MPEISRFYGIIIKMFFKPKEHEPSHIHALYGEYVEVFWFEKLWNDIWWFTSKGTIVSTGMVETEQQ